LAFGWAFFPALCLLFFFLLFLCFFAEPSPAAQRTNLLARWHQPTAKHRQTT
jgi:hypothetical protein